MKTQKIWIVVVAVTVSCLASGSLLAQEISGLQATAVDTAATLTISVTLGDPSASKTIFVQVDEADSPTAMAKAYPVVLVRDTYYVKDGDQHQPLQSGHNQFVFPYEVHPGQLRLTFFVQNKQGTYSNKLSTIIEHQ